MMDSNKELMSAAVPELAVWLQLKLLSGKQHHQFCWTTRLLAQQTPCPTHNAALPHGAIIQPT